PISACQFGSPARARMRTRGIYWAALWPNDFENSISITPTSFAIVSFCRSLMPIRPPAAHFKMRVAPKMDEAAFGGGLFRRIFFDYQVVQVSPRQWPRPSCSRNLTVG